MTSTTFIEFTTPIEATWLNDVNDHVYNEASGAIHDAVNISAVPSGVITTNNVQSALEELSSGILNLDSSYVLLDGSNVMTGDLRVTRTSGQGAAIWIADEVTTGDHALYTAYADDLDPIGTGIKGAIGYEKNLGFDSMIFGCLGATDSHTGWAGMTAQPTNGAFRTRLIGNTQIVRNDPLQHFLETGYQTSESGGITEYRHRLTFLGNIHLDGTVTTPAADYAELFEWSDGNSSNEDRRGISVVLDNGKIRPATGGDSTDDIIGVISGSPSVLGDDSWNHWHDRFLRDEFNTPIMEDYELVTVEVDEPHPVTGNTYRARHNIAEEDALTTYPNHNLQIVERQTLQREKKNPAYDPNQEYVPRTERPEWDPVGMVGKVRVKAGQPVGTRWIKIRDISASVEEWLVR